MTPPLLEQLDPFEPLILNDPPSERKTSPRDQPSAKPLPAVPIQFSELQPLAVNSRPESIIVGASSIPPRFNNANGTSPIRKPLPPPPIHPPQLQSETRGPPEQGNQHGVPGPAVPSFPSVNCPPPPGRHNPKHPKVLTTSPLIRESRQDTVPCLQTNVAQEKMEMPRKEQSAAPFHVPPPTSSLYYSAPLGHAVSTQTNQYGLESLKPNPDGNLIEVGYPVAVPVIPEAYCVEQKDKEEIEDPQCTCALARMAPHRRSRCKSGNTGKAMAGALAGAGKAAHHTAGASAKGIQSAADQAKYKAHETAKAAAQHGSRVVDRVKKESKKGGHQKRKKKELLGDETTQGQASAELSLTELDHPCECSLASLAPHSKSRCKNDGGDTKHPHAAMPSFLNEQKAPKQHAPWGGWGAKTTAQPTQQSIGRQGVPASNTVPVAVPPNPAPSASRRGWQPPTIFNRDPPCHCPLARVSPHRASRCADATGAAAAGALGATAAAVLGAGPAGALGVGTLVGAGSLFRNRALVEQEQQRQAIVAQQQRQLAASTIVSALFGVIFAISVGGISWSVGLFLVVVLFFFLLGLALRMANVKDPISGNPLGLVSCCGAAPARPAAATGAPSRAPRSLFSRDPPCTCAWARASPHRRSKCANVRAGGALAVTGGPGGPRAGAAVGVSAGGAAGAGWGGGSAVGVRPVAGVGVGLRGGRLKPRVGLGLRLTV